MSWEEVSEQNILSYFILLEDVWPGLTSNKPTHYLLVLGNGNFTHFTLFGLQPFSQDYNLASHTTQLMCFNFIRERTLLPLNDRLFEKFFIAKFYSERKFFQEYSSPKNYFLIR